MFTRAVRAGSPVIVGIVSQSGWGKTYSALLVARGLAGPTGKIAVIDTESGRAKHYADLTPFDHDNLIAPFSPGRYIEKIKEAVAAGYNVIVIDQGSFEWNGTGGILEMAEATGKEGLLKWNKPKVAHRRFLNALLETPVHCIICLRGKPEFTQTGSGASAKVTRGAIVAQQHEDFLYEMTVSMVFDKEDAAGNPMPGIARLVKCPAALLHAFPEGKQVGQRTGELLAEWVKGGAPVDHAFETLKNAGREAALDGSVALRKWFDGLVTSDKAKAKPLLDAELKSAAKSADDMAAMKVDAPQTSDALEEPKNG